MSVTPTCEGGVPRDVLAERPEVPVRTVDCADCSMCHTDVCDDCVVTFVVNRNPGEALVIDVAEERPCACWRAGLVPELRHASGA